MTTPMSNERLAKIDHDNHFKEDGPPFGDVADMLAEIKRLRAVEIAAIEYKTYYDRIFSASVVVPTEEYIKGVAELDKLRSQLSNTGTLCEANGKELERLRAAVGEMPSTEALKQTVTEIGFVIDEGAPNRMALSVVADWLRSIAELKEGSDDSR